MICFICTTCENRYLITSELDKHNWYNFNGRIISTYPNPGFNVDRYVSDVYFMNEDIIW